MKSIISFLFSCLFLVGISQNNKQEFIDGLPVLTIEDELMLKSLPEKTIPTDYASRSLPAIVDNSQSLFMRPAFNQSHYACGQASLIGYNFTYEMARERNVAANNANNQYPTHFAWNFMNGGNGYYGVSYLHSAQILKFCGTPNVTEYGGMADGGYERWMSGFSNYLSAMGNRITSISQIQVGTEEELQTLKYWLYDHLENSEYGGLASFYAQYLSVNQTFPSGTPEAGKYVITSFGGSPNHAMTIVGYNDEIRWDYNNDGQYTNDIDINNDGIVNMKDWEIGGFKMVQSYGGVPNWGDQGYAYMMYKTVADELGQGGVWNHCVHVIDVKETCGPELVAKVTLKHDRRGAVKLMVGFSNNMSATAPEYLLDLPIFDYQGGDNYMQGGETEADKTIEFGLDLSPLLTDMILGQPVKFFVQVEENDPWHLGNGEIVSFSIIDYTNGTNEIVSPQTNIPIIDNDITTVTLTHTLNFNRIEIETDILPEAVENEPYSLQLTASGGAMPYFWDFDKAYEETSSSENFIEINETQLYPSNYSSGTVTQELEFDFPFFDSVFSSITLHVDGYLMFDQQIYPYPYFNDDNVLFKSSRNISPFMTQHQQIYTSYGGGLWYEGDGNSATFRWKAKITDDYDSDLNYSVTLFPNGEIEFNYGIMLGYGDLEWCGGVSDGDVTNYTRTSNSNDRVIQENNRIHLAKYDYPEEMSISSDGLFSGIPAQSYNGSSVKFKVTDNSFVSSSKELFFTSNNISVQVDDSISSGGDEIVEYGELASLSFKIINDGEVEITNAILTISSVSDHITILDNNEMVGNIAVGESVSIIDGVSFQVHNDIPNGRVITIRVQIADDHTSWEIPFNYIAFAPEIEIAEVFIDDENGLLDPGETTDIAIVLFNDGGASLNDLLTSLTTQSQLVTLNNQIGEISTMEPEAIDTLNFNVTVSETALSGEQVVFSVAIEGANDYESFDSFTLKIGINEEDFESGDFSMINWGYDGDEEWQIDNYLSYEGEYSARSGFIIDNQSSTLIADITVVSGGDISFYKNVSSESTADYLGFYIDGEEQSIWSGESNWTYHTFYLNPGFHRLEWKYQKNESNSENMDGAWIDLISFPAILDSPPSLVFDLSSLSVSMPYNQNDVEIISIENLGDESIRYNTYISSNDQVFSVQERNVQGSYLYCSEGTVNSGETYQIELTLYNTSMDNEWLKDVNIEFPTGITLLSATNFTGGSEDLVFEGELGNGTTATWHGEDINGWGVLQGGQTATSIINVFIEESFSEHFSLSYVIYGDMYGGEPHVMLGEIPFRNLGVMLEWISIEQIDNILEGGQTDQINLNIDTWNLEVGTYDCNLLVLDNFKNEHIIPINLEVEQYVDLIDHVLEKNNLNTYPNPFNDYVDFKIRLKSESDVMLEIFELNGRKLISLLNGKMDAGTQVIRWDGKTNKGFEAKAGVYICKFRQGKTYIYKRIIKN